MLLIDVNTPAFLLHRIFIPPTNAYIFNYINVYCQCQVKVMYKYMCIYKATYTRRTAITLEKILIKRSNLSEGRKREERREKTLTSTLSLLNYVSMPRPQGSLILSSIFFFFFFIIKRDSPETREKKKLIRQCTVFNYYK